MNLDKYALYVILFLLAVAICCCAIGCNLVPQQPDNYMPEDPANIIYRTVEKTNWMVTLSILGVGAGFFAFLNGGGKGIQVMAACLVVLCLTLGIMRYATWIAFSGAVGAVGLVAYTAYIKNRALREIIAGGERFNDITSKMEGADYVASTFFEEQDKVQSPTTKKIVDDIQKKV